MYMRRFDRALCGCHCGDIFVQVRGTRPSWPPLYPGPAASSQPRTTGRPLAAEETLGCGRPGRARLVNEDPTRKRDQIADLFHFLVGQLVTRE